MRILLDECVDPRVKGLLRAHDVRTVHEMGWDTLKDASLLNLAQEHFDIFFTIDRKLEHQQNLAKLSLAVVVVEVPKNRFRFYERIQAELLRAIERADPGRATHVRGRASPD